MGLPVSGLVFLSLAATCAIVSGFLVYQEIGEVNRKLSDEERIPYLFMYPGKMQKIRTQYERLYPKARVDLWRRLFQAAALVFLALTALFGGFLR